MVIRILIIFPIFSKYLIGVLKAKLFSIYLITLEAFGDFSMDVK